MLPFSDDKPTSGARIPLESWLCSASRRWRLATRAVHLYSRLSIVHTFFLLAWPSIARPSAEVDEERLQTAPIGPVSSR